MCPNSTSSKEPERVSRDDCHLSFLSPEGVEYIKVVGAFIAVNDECYIAFNYTGGLRVKPGRHMPAMPEDWRAMTDFALTVEKTPVTDSLAKIESADGAPQHGLFKMTSKDHVPLSGGDLYIVSYAATKPTANMIRFNETKEIIFVAGNNARSIVFQLYYGDRIYRAEKERGRVIRDIFLSLRFFD